MTGFERRLIADERRRQAYDSGAHGAGTTQGRVGAGQRMSRVVERHLGVCRSRDVLEVLV